MSCPGHVVYLWDEVCSTERVGVGLWSRRVVRFFLSRSDGGSCPYRKRRQKKRNLNLHFDREFFHCRERVIHAKLLVRYYKFFLIAIALFQKVYPAESGCFPTKFGGFPRKLECFLCPRFLPSRGCAFLGILPS